MNCRADISGLICLYYIMLGIRVANAYANSMLERSRQGKFLQEKKPKKETNKLDDVFEDEIEKKKTRIGKF